MVYLFDKHNIKLDEIRRYMYLLDDNKKKKIEKANNKKKIECIVGRLLLKYTLKEEFGMSYKGVNVSYNIYGKPYIISNTNINFNISHSGDLIVCASDKFDIGVDVEKIRKVRYGVVNNYFFDLEIENLSKLSEKLRRQYFYYIWTGRESFMKNIGKGICMSLNEFEIKEYNMDYQVIRYGSNKYYVYNYLTKLRKEEYIISICSTKKREDKLLLLKYEEIIS